MMGWNAEKTLDLLRRSADSVWCYGVRQIKIIKIEK
jgi:hypothetical protein